MSFQELELQFEFPEGISDEDKANKLMEFLVNRTAQFNRDKFDEIYLLDLKDDVESFMMYKIMAFVAIGTSIAIKMPYSAKKLPYFNQDNDNQIFGVRFILSYQAKKYAGALQFSSYTVGQEHPEFDTRPNIFLGFTHETLAFIADTLYDYKLPEERVHEC